jgi:Kef-type K+ transport system membrane component KefB
LLGPSALCRNAYFKEVIFPDKSIPYLSLVANIGLTFYLFIIGIELDTKLLMTHARKTTGIAVAGMVVPFALGIAISRTMIDTLQKDMETDFTGFFVFIGTALSITAFPVLARILKEGGLIYTKAGAMTLGAAAINDAIAWCLLALAISLASGGDMNVTGYIFGTMVGIAVFQMFVMKPFLEYVVEYSETNNVKWIKDNLFGFTICILFMSAWFTGKKSLFSLFGFFSHPCCSFLFSLILFSRIDWFGFYLWCILIWFSYSKRKSFIS